MTHTAFLLVHSPLVGPSSFAPLAAELQRRDRTAITPDLTDFVTAAPPLWRAYRDAAVAGAGAATQLVVAGHSGAGAMLPMIADKLAERVSAVIFVDAVVPPVTGQHRTPAPMAALLDQQTEGGLLNPWLDWWDPEVVDALIPDRASQATIRQDMPRVPRSFYDECVPVPDRWSAAGCAYLRLSDAYDAELTEAQERAWPTLGHDGTHLSIVTEPGVVADAMVQLVDQVTGMQRRR